MTTVSSHSLQIKVQRQQIKSAYSKVAETVAATKEREFKETDMLVPME